MASEQAELMAQVIVERSNVERITHERNRALADLDMDEQLIRTLHCQKRLMMGALEHIVSELRAVMPYVPTHGALADHISAQIVHAQTTLQSVTEED